MVEREARRLEVMKRRQERELSQLISYELMRKEMQEKAEAKVGGSVGVRGEPWCGCVRRQSVAGWKGSRARLQRRKRAGT